MDIFMKEATQGSFHKSFVPIGHVVSDKIFNAFPIRTCVKTYVRCDGRQDQQIQFCKGTT